MIISLSTPTLYPGLQLTIYGSGFGATQQGGYVAIGPEATGVVTGWSNSTVVVTVPSTGLEPGNLTVEQYGVVSNGVAYTVQ
ncbi:MAG: IPT/TIG domain-containing protein [Candidatus Sulfotelmatobacter sp.]